MGRWVDKSMDVECRWVALEGALTCDARLLCQLPVHEAGVPCVIGIRIVAPIKVGFYDINLLSYVLLSQKTA